MGGIGWLGGGGGGEHLMAGWGGGGGAKHLNQETRVNNRIKHNRYKICVDFIIV